MKDVIKLNDSLENGGYTNKASGSKFTGIPVALQRDAVVCILHKGTFLMPGLELTRTMDGKGIVADGCRATYGCVTKIIPPTVGTSK